MVVLVLNVDFEVVFKGVKGIRLCGEMFKCYVGYIVEFIDFG